MKTKAKQVVVVDLTGIHPEMIYAWGCETGAFAAYSFDRMCDDHVIYAGNLGMIELICADRHFDLDVISTSPDGVYLAISISPMRGVK